MSSVPDSSSLPSSTLVKRSNPMSLRRQNKPLIEKRRRARINDCLLQLKKLLAKDGEQESCKAGSKLEKADILEMTVNFVRKMAGRQLLADETDSSGPCTDNAAASFQDGISRCMEEVDSFLHSQGMLEPDVRHRLLSHCCQQPSPRDGSVGEPVRSHHPVVQDKQTKGVKPVSCHRATPSSAQDSKVLGKVCLPNHETSRKMAASSELHVKDTPICEAQFQNSEEVSGRDAQVSSNSTSMNNDGADFVAPLNLICAGNVFVLVDQQHKGRAHNVLFPVLTKDQRLYTPTLHSSSAFAACPAHFSPRNNVSGTAPVSDSVTPVVASKTECLTRQGEKVNGHQYQWNWHSHKVDKVAPSPSLLCDSQGPGAPPHTGQDRGAPPHTGQDPGAPPHTGQDRGAPPHTGQDPGAPPHTGQDPGAPPHTGQGDTVPGPLHSPSVCGDKRDSRVKPNSWQNEAQNAITLHSSLSEKQNEGLQPCSRHPGKVQVGLQHGDLLLVDVQGVQTLHPHSLGHNVQDMDTQFCSQQTVGMNSPLEHLAGDNMEIQLNHSWVENTQSAVHSHNLWNDIHPKETRNYHGWKAERMPSDVHAYGPVNKPAHCTPSAPERPESLRVAQYPDSDINNNEVGLSHPVSMWRPW